MHADVAAVVEMNTRTCGSQHQNDAVTSEEQPGSSSDWQVKKGYRFTQQAHAR